MQNQREFQPYQITVAFRELKSLKRLRRYHQNINRDPKWMRRHMTDLEQIGGEALNREEYAAKAASKWGRKTAHEKAAQRQSNRQERRAARRHIIAGMMELEQERFEEYMDNMIEMHDLDMMF